MTRLLFALAAGAVLLGCPPTSTISQQCEANSDCATAERCCGGVCRDIRVEVNHCGACGNVCSGTNGTPACEGALCRITCNQGFADCDQHAANGCEVNLSSNVNHCGSCGVVCSGINAAATCVAGGCSSGGCNTGFANCDGLSSTGCETRIDDDPNHCGKCDNKCALANAVAKCFVQSCQVDNCRQGFGDCDGVVDTGCETDLLTSNDHCGACSNAAGADHTCINGALKPRALVGYGGFDEATGSPTKSLWYFHPGTKQFQVITPAAPDGEPGERYRHAAAWDKPSNRMIVYGGEGTGALPSDAWALDFAQDPPTWTKLPASAQSPEPRREACAAHDPVGRKLYLFGGFDANGKDLGDLWVLDLANGAWTRLHDATESPMPEARTDPSCAFDPATGKLFVFGGDSVALPGQPSGDTWERDTDEATPAWKLVPVTLAPSARQGARFFEGQSPLALFGGKYKLGFNPRQHPDDVWKLDVAAQDWVLESSEGDPGLPPGRWGHATAVLGGKRYLYGGLQERDSFPQQRLIYDDVWSYDPATGKWTELWTPATAGAPKGTWGATLVAVE